MTTKTKKILLRIKNNFTSISIANMNDEASFLNKAATEVQAGKNIIEFDGSKLSSKDYCSVGKKLRTLTAEFDALLIIYDRIDIARIIEADGIMLDKNSISLQDAKRMTENDLIIGFRAENINEAKFAEENEADFVAANIPISLDIPVFSRE